MPAEVKVNIQFNLFQVSIEDQKRIQEVRRQLLEKDNPPDVIKARLLLFLLFPSLTLHATQEGEYTRSPSTGF